MNLLCILVSLGFKIVLAVMILHSANAQESWDHRDPVDLGIIDLADNKLLLYNLAGMGLFEWIGSGSHHMNESEQGWSQTLYADGWREYKRPPLDNLIALRLRNAYTWRPRLEIGYDVQAGVVWQDVSTDAFLGTSIFFSWVVIKSDHFHLAYDNGVGPNIFSNSFPMGGTRFNFSTYYGLKAAVKIKETYWLVLILRNLHISNADIRGRDRNPAYDGLGLSIGLGL